MLSKNKPKLIRSLARKKVRDEEGLFLAEGPKTVGELLRRFSCLLLAGTEEGLRSVPADCADEVAVLTETELSQASLQKTPQGVLAVFRKSNIGETSAATVETTRPEKIFSRPEKKTSAEVFSRLYEKGRRELVLVLDGVQDPGNLGTIVRLADWFGITTVVCSADCADLFSPKTVQSTMGAVARVQTAYVDLPAFLGGVPEGVPVYGTFLDGENIYGRRLTSAGFIVMGSEGHGISPAVERCVTARLFIPSFPAGRPTSESLNVAVATAVTCAEFRRQQGFTI